MISDPTATADLEPADLEPADLDVHVDLGFEAFVRARGDALCRMAFLLLGDRHLAEDMTQTALAKVAGRWDRIVANGDPMPYVRTVLLRTVIAWRRRRWHGEIPTDVVPDGPTGPIDDPRHQLHRALGQLTARQRAVLVLRFYEDLSEADTARLLGCSVGTVKSQSAKARARLRELLGPDITLDPEEER